MTNDIISSFFNYLIYMQLLLLPFSRNMHQLSVCLSASQQIFSRVEHDGNSTFIYRFFFFEFFFFIYKKKVFYMDWMWKYTTIFIPFKYSVCKTCVKSILLHRIECKYKCIIYIYIWLPYTKIEKGMLKLKFHPPKQCLYEHNISCFSLWGK